MKIIRNNFFLLAVAIIFVGCSTINFSANYYTPPDYYKEEVYALLDEIQSYLPLKYKYTMKITEDNESQGTKGVPEIRGTHIKLTNNLVKYVYQNYFDERHKIIACVIVHEMSHSEFNMLSEPVETHFQVDLKAVSLLENSTSITPKDFYYSLIVLKNYWFARKGVAGHAVNVGWNVLNAAALVYVGHGSFVNWFATDIRGRLKRFRKHYNQDIGKGYERSTSPENIEFIEDFFFEGLFSEGA